MCSSLNPQKSIRIDAELCDGVQAYALANRLALKPRWFSNFINSAVREKLVREGFLPADAPYSHSDGSPSALRGSGNFAVRENLIPEGVLAGNSTNDTPDGSRRVLGGSAAQGGDVLEDKKLLDRIAQSEEPYLAYLTEKNSRADNQDNYPRGFNYPQNLDDKADVPVGCKKPAFVDSINNCRKGGEEVIGDRRVITYPANIKTGTAGLIVDVSDVPAPKLGEKSDSSESQNREVR